MIKLFAAELTPLLSYLLNMSMSSTYRPTLPDAHLVTCAGLCCTINNRQNKVMERIVLICDEYQLNTAVLIKNGPTTSDI